MRTLTEFFEQEQFLVYRKFSESPAVVAFLLKLSLKIEVVSKETQPFVYQTGAKMDDELLGKMKQAGMKVNEADKQAFQKASKAIYDEFSAEVPDGKQMIDKAIALGSAK